MVQPDRKIKGNLYKRTDKENMYAKNEKKLKGWKNIVLEIIDKFVINDNWEKTFFTRDVLLYCDEIEKLRIIYSKEETDPDIINDLYLDVEDNHNRREITKTIFLLQKEGYFTILSTRILRPPNYKARVKKIIVKPYKVYAKKQIKVKAHYDEWAKRNPERYQAIITERERVSRMYDNFDN